jgi:hypothetical protein
MTTTKDNSRVWLALATLISAGQVSLIWSFRFLPVYDYPNWLYQARIFADLVKGGSHFGSDYWIPLIPVPNVIFTVLASILGQILDFEVAGKILLTASVLLLPWGFWFVVPKFGAAADSAVRYVAFPFGISMFTLNAQNYTLALGLLFWFLACFQVSCNSRSFVRWSAISAGIVLIYFSHGIVFLLLALLLISAMVVQPPAVRLRIGMALVPSIALAVWYRAAVGENGSSGAVLGAATVVRHLIKPACLFFKSYGITPAFPPTYLNVAWLLLICFFVVSRVWKGYRERRLQLWIGIPGGILLFFAALIPDPAFKVVQPGARFVLPALLMLLLASASIPARKWHPIFLGFAVVALIHNFMMFRSFNDRATDLTSQLENGGGIQKPVYIIALDWAVDSNISERVAPSINAMSFVPLYSFAQREIPYGVFETGVIAMRDSLRRLHPEISGSDISTWFGSMFAEPERFLRFHTIVLFGEGEYVNAALQILQQKGFNQRSHNQGWYILEKK